MKSSWVDRKVAFGFVWAFFGAVMLISAWFSSASTISFLRNAVPAEGTVTELEERRSTGRRNVFDRTNTYATIDFAASDGSQTQIEAPTGWGVPSDGVGGKVQLLYLEDAPEDARVDSVLGIWLGTIMPLGLAVLFGAVGYIKVIPAWRQHRGNTSSHIDWSQPTHGSR